MDVIESRDRSGLFEEIQKLAGKAIQELLELELRGNTDWEVLFDETDKSVSRLIVISGSLERVYGLANVYKKIPDNLNYKDLVDGLKRALIFVQGNANEKNVKATHDMLCLVQSYGIAMGEHILPE